MPSDNVQHELQRCSLTKMGEIAPHTQHTLYTNTKKRTANSSSCDDRLDLDIEPTNGQPASCRARPVNIDDRLVDIMWTRCVGGEMLPTAAYALRTNLNKFFFCLREKRDREFLSFVFYTAADDTPSILMQNTPTVNALRVGQGQ